MHEESRMGDYQHSVFCGEGQAQTLTHGHINLKYFYVLIIAEGEHTTFQKLNKFFEIIIPCSLVSVVNHKPMFR